MSDGPTAQRLQALVRSIRAEQRTVARRWAAIERALAKLRARGEGDSYAYWRMIAGACAEQPPPYRAAGIRSVSALVRALGGVTRRAFDRNVLVARTFDEDAWNAYPRALLEEIALLERSRGGLDADRLPLDPGSIRAGRGRSECLAADCSVATLRRLRTAGARSPEVRRLQAAVRADRALAGVSVRQQGDRFSIHGIAPEQMPALAAALARQRQARETR